MITQLRYLPQETPEPEHLAFIAFSGQHDVAHGVFKRIPEDIRESYGTKYVFSEVTIGGINTLRKLLANSAQVDAHEEKQFLDDTVRSFVRYCHEQSSFPRELFDTLLRWADELNRLSRLEEALFWYNEALELGVKNFPHFYSRALLGKAHTLNCIGKFDEAKDLLLSLIERPYMITERNLIPELLFTLGRDSLLTGNVLRYKQLLFQGLRHFYTNMENRKTLVEQLGKTYRKKLQFMLDSDIGIANRFLYVLHRVYFALNDLRVLRLAGIAPSLRYTILGFIYLLNYYRVGSMRERPSPTSLLKKGIGLTRTISPYSAKRDILVTRGMGGIGDLLMMTPGLHALKEMYPEKEIHLAIPKRYFPIFKHNPDVKLVDIEETSLDHLRYRKWFNFTDCPASRVEARIAPKVKKNRIEIFAKALGVRLIHRWKMDYRPRYFISDEEREIKGDFWAKNNLDGRPVIGIQLRSEEIYRDFPHMKELARELAKEYHVIVFDTEPIEGYEDSGIIKLSGVSLRVAFSIASGCDVIVAPDSSFVHFAGAMDIPCVALYGPIDGLVRTKDYPRCTPIDVRESLGCIACWRNEQIPCKLTEMRTSACLSNIPIQKIQVAVRSAMERLSTYGNK